MLYIESYRNINKISSDSIIINTTSRSDDWGKEFSPFTMHCGHLYGDYYAKNVENGWQFAKTYTIHVDENENPTPYYFEWAQKGWNSNYAYRYPMGKSVKPLYSYWDGEKLSYIEARKKIYTLLYGRNVINTDAFKRLLELYNTTEKDIYLIDFDGYNHIQMGMSLNDVANDPNKKMGHAFVIYALIKKYSKMENSENQLLTK